MKLQAVFFDMGGTIQTYWFDRSLRVKNASLLRDRLCRGGIRIDFDDEHLADAISVGIAAYKKWSQQTLIELPPLEIWSKYFLKNFSIDRDALAPIAEDLSYLFETRFFVRKMRPEIPQVLARIREMGLRIGCISNVQCRRQVPDNLKEYGILNFFDPIVLSSEYGSRKPDPSIFYQAARLASLPTGACVYVGDKLNRDIIGAKRSGFRLAVQIRHHFDEGDVDEGAAPDAVIEDMLELLPLLESEAKFGLRSQAAHNGRKINGIFFDAGNILYHRPHRGQYIKQFLAVNMHSPVPNMIRKRMKLKDLAFQGVLDRDAYYEKLIRLYGFDDPQVIAQGVTALVQDATTVEIIKGVPETLKALKASGFILGIITDTATPISAKLNWFEEAGFGHVWDSIISSRELGTRKPAPVIYEEAFLRTGLKVDEAVFVGHKASELKGARSVGMATIAFNYSPSAVADFYISKFSDLLKVPLLNDHS
jgi:putative hydrolase of the HAD superfamily